ncbi:MAG: cell division protein DivIVA [Erysipelotrichales bacterium]|nr:MAG: cell division protein DivIVA [Erysipelotrichales bacterium]
MEIKKPKFRLMKNGYDRFAVDDAVDRMFFENETMRQQLETYRSQINHAGEQLNQIKTRYQALISELTVREKAADDIARLALKEANTIIDTAQNNADAIVREALSTARQLLAEIARIGNNAKDVKEEMKIKLQALIKALEDFEIPDIPGSDQIINDKEQDKSL